MCKTSVYTIVNGNMQQRLDLNRNTKKNYIFIFCSASCRDKAAVHTYTTVI